MPLLHFASFSKALLVGLSLGCLGFAGCLALDNAASHLFFNTPLRPGQGPEPPEIPELHFAREAHITQLTSYTRITRTARMESSAVVFAAQITITGCRDRDVSITVYLLDDPALVPIGHSILHPMEDLAHLTCELQCHTNLDLFRSHPRFTTNEPLRLVTIIADPEDDTAYLERNNDWRFDRNPLVSDAYSLTWVKTIEEAVDGDSLVLRLLCDTFILGPTNGPIIVTARFRRFDSKEWVADSSGAPLVLSLARLTATRSDFTYWPNAVFDIPYAEVTRADVPLETRLTAHLQLVFPDGRCEDFQDNAVAHFAGGSVDRLVAHSRGGITSLQKEVQSLEEQVHILEEAQ